MTRMMLKFAVALSAFLPSVFPGMQVCAIGAGSEKFDPPALYLTWQGDPTTTMTIRWHNMPDDRCANFVKDQRLNMLRDSCASKVKYQRHDKTEWYIKESSPYPMKHSKRIVHVVELTGLDPGMVYKFRLGENGENSDVFKFRTMPRDLTKEVRFIVGGDTYGKGKWWCPCIRGDQYYYNLLRKNNLQASKKSPMFVVIGGDFAYANGEEGEVERWYKWLDAWKKDMVTSDNLLIPLVPVIGNHEVVRKGSTKWFKKGYKKEWDKPNKPSNPAEHAPYFYNLFIKTDSLSCKTDSLSYRVLDFDNYMSLILLDSGHTNYVHEQKEWLERTLKERQDQAYKFAAYHVPAYPSHRDTSDKISTHIRTHWVPQFEQFGLDVAFEHHDHTYKRTHSILNNKEDKEDSKGVVYLGDGAWGKLRKPGQQDQWYIAKAREKYHFILVTLQKDKALFQAIDNDGQVFDKYCKGKCEATND